MVYTGIYRIVCEVTGKCYVGSAKNIMQRWKTHRTDLRGNKHCNKRLQNSWNKHGEEAFSWKVLEHCSIASLIDREQYWLDITKAVELGFNIMHRAESVLGFKHSLEAKAKMSLAAQGREITAETRAKIAAALVGRKHSPEHIAKHATNLKGYKHPPETRARMAAAQKGLKRSPEAIAKTAAANTGRIFSEERKAQMRAANLGKRHSAATKAKMSERKKGKPNGRKGFHRSEETKEKIRNTKALNKACL